MNQGMRFWMTAALVLVLLVGLDGAAGQALDPALKVSPLVLADTANGQVGHFLVVLRSQADTARAAASSAVGDRHRRVYSALRAAAQASQPGVTAQLDRLGAAYQRFTVVNLIAVTGSRSVVEAMAARPDVAYLTPDRAFQAPLEQPDQQAPAATQGIEWNLSWIHADAVWAKGFTGQGIVYANADTGVDWQHPALRPHYRGVNGDVVDHNYNWWDAIRQDFIGNLNNVCGFQAAAPCDDYGHGTHTMGIGIGDDGAGNQVGVAPGAKWIACRNMENGVGRPSTYIACLDFFMAPWDLNGLNPDPSNHADVVGNSYGCPPSELCGPHDLQAAVQNLRNAGIFMAVSAGNAGGAGCSSITDPPALEESVITVGATGYLSNAIAGLSSRGPVTVDGSGRRKPDLVAPGISVRSSYLGGGYATLSGTSMAAPHVAGAVALLWSAYPALRGQVDQTEMVLTQSALHLTTSQGCGGDWSSVVPNNVYGYGLLDVLAAYQYYASPTPTPGIRIFIPWVQK